MRRLHARFTRHGLVRLPQESRHMQDLHTACTSRWSSTIALSFVLSARSSLLVFKLSRARRRRIDWSMHTLEVKAEHRARSSTVMTRGESRPARLSRHGRCRHSSSPIETARADDRSESLAALRALVADNPPQSDASRRARSRSSTERLATIEETLASMRRADAAEAVDLVRNRGRAAHGLMCAGSIDELDQVESDLLIQRRTAAAERREQFFSGCRSHVGRLRRPRHCSRS